ncbi:tryptophan synthase beta subunit-like PLP-dependent enzyme [Lipomyces tetrasporus]|uniref:threonine synthase n=1 Tax=Lipomyces tetrasporus TaxID=54092 RepID=A0AAD7QV16_9ASCO|nr:tryptophan synthase beta subunit-like PLP-dependent enzyme [Lipomyces tetrasporus]KAJ8101939.1 tryptophan synthase beta subunit-like PLP-dependent enzyme [Lipomyces tetrasporus]
MTLSQQYLSTRSSGEPYLSFEATVLRGLAPGGGLFIPAAIPTAPADFLTNWQDLSFQELAFEIFSLYISQSEISSEELKQLIARSYSTFRDESVTPLTVLDEQRKLYLLELFHGPTYAFKDVALQFVGNLFEFFLQRKNAGKTAANDDRDRLTVVGATSGDTGSAAIYGLRNKKDVSIFILHPLDKVSPIQELQMTTVTDANVHNFAVRGNFDDCQDIVKTLFDDVAFNQKHHLGAVNSINWARILAQITYYFYSYFSLLRKTGGSRDIAVRYVVPTGNFGDILAGFYAKRMGLPVDKLIVATNANDILDRFWKSGVYEKKAPGSDVEAVKETLSPAMDILISSNFERLLWYLAREQLSSSNEEAGQYIQKWMVELKSTGKVTVPQKVLDSGLKEFASECVTDEQTVETIKETYDLTSGYILDPHTSVGVTASLRHVDGKHTYVALSTAHPAKFADAVNLALTCKDDYSFDNVLPDAFKALKALPKKVTVIERPDTELVKAAIEKELNDEGIAF